MVHSTLGPDEAIYLGQAKALRAGGLHALRDLGAEYADEPTLKSFPSPLRWLWAALVAVTLPVSTIFWQVSSALAIGPVVFWITESWQAALLASTSPLTITLCRRKLQDVPVALAALVTIGFALHHSPVGVAAALFVALSLKESSMFAAPAIVAAWLLSGGAVLPLAASVCAGATAWLAALAILFGKQLPAMLRQAKSGHVTKYAAEHQVGAPHRLLVDLVLVSPSVVLLAAYGASSAQVIAASAVALVVTHAAAPIRNVRFIIAADVLLRVVAVASLPAVALPILLACDAFIAWRMRWIYDPVTHSLATAMGMPTVSANK